MKEKKKPWTEKYNWTKELSNNYKSRLVEDRTLETTESEDQKEKRIKKWRKPKVLWDTMRRNNICIIAIPEGEEKEKGIESIFKAMMAENFLILGRKMDIHFHEA